ncbi:MAG: hypothetical protein ACLFS3_02480 [Candidatus Aenigmatarchaeota archaeon]
MKVKIKERKDNPFLDRKELKGIIDHTGEATPSEEALREFLAKELNKDSEDIEVDKIFTFHGRQKSKFWAKELGAETTEKLKKEETEEKTEEETEEKGEDYEEFLGGTIGEGKDKIKSMDNPDYEKLLEIEKNNKDRKGMKKFLEGKIGE